MTHFHLEQVVTEAARVAPQWAASDGPTRAQVLRAIADGLDRHEHPLVEQADRETNLGQARLKGELARATFQLRGFAEEVERGAAFTCLIEGANPAPPPAGRPHMMRVRVPVGPVAVFAASNFPFAFSVPGGDTASALAAGCPVVVRPHPGHPILSRQMHGIAVDALQTVGADPALLGLFEGGGIQGGIELVRHPAIGAVAFTGSARAGLALQEHAARRERPIPFYGELGSVNPVVVLPAALDGNVHELARILAGSMTLGCGQFCTSPGVIVVFREASATKDFVETLCRTLSAAPSHHMLNANMRANFERGVERLLGCEGVEQLVGSPTNLDLPPRPMLIRVTPSGYLKQPVLREEVFGPAAIMIEVASADEAVAVLNAIGGTLTTTIWGAHTSSPANQQIVRAAFNCSGRVIFSGVPTGVAVTGAQQHGGPFPSSTQPSTTSVGYAAMDRFLRPIALQDAPEWVAGNLGRPI